MGRGTRAASAVLMTVLAISLVVELAGPAQAMLRTSTSRPAPVFHTGGFADPAVARYAHGYVAVATGTRAPRAVSTSPRGPWKPVRPALPSLPAWARPGAVWASDLTWTGKGWLLYYSALARGGHRRCIGVATAARALDPFRPVGRRPLVCPPRGAIDPSAYSPRGGGRRLLYKTQGLPTSIRMVRLTRDGRHRVRGAAPRVLLRSRRTIVENPVLVRRGRMHVLFTSEGSFEDCGYRTTWRVSRTLHRWTRPHLLIGRHGNRLCGPGGADVSTGRRGRLVFFHGWTCDRWRACPSRFHAGRRGHPHARRALYAAHLRWNRGPRLGRFVRPIRW